MFNLFGRKTVKDFEAEAKETYGVPQVAPISFPQQEHKDLYRVGRTTDGYTTLTLRGEYGATMTLTMNQEACEQMIRMLESTFSIEVAKEENV